MRMIECELYATMLASLCELFATMLALKAGFASVRTAVTRRAAEHGLEELVHEVDAVPVEALAGPRAVTMRRGTRAQARGSSSWRSRQLGF